MPTYRELQQQLRQAGFKSEWGKGSHRKWSHPTRRGIVVLPSNHLGDTAPAYQQRRIERLVRDTN